MVKNNKGYMLVEIVLASALAFGIALFIINLTLKLKNKNDDLLISTLMSTDQAIITNKMIAYAKDEKKDFNCNNITIDDKKIKYGTDIIDVINDYATIKDGVFDGNNKITSNYCSNSDGRISIIIPLIVPQMSEKDFDVSVDYKYQISDIMKPNASINNVNNAKVELKCSDNNLISSYIFQENSIPDINGNFVSINPQKEWREEINYNANRAYYLVCKDVNGNISSIASYDYWTEVGEHTFTIPQTGYYKIETWGAEGGQGSRNGNPLIAGGKGGYVSGIIYFTKDTSFFINVGGKGKDGNGWTNTGAAGGYNGGGKGGDNSNGEEAAYGGADPAGGGGGATHIAKQSGVLKNLSNAKDKIMMVAGGGGGGSWGNVGGGGGDSRYVATSFGYGSNGCSYPGGSGAGGGGYYGGRTDCWEDGKGYGGSSYTSNAFTNVSTTIGNNSGDGKARLVWYGDSL